MQPASIARLSLRCPVSLRSALVTFLVPGPAGQPSDITACSLFPGDEVGCNKNCLGPVRATWGPPPGVIGPR